MKRIDPALYNGLKFFEDNNLNDYKDTIDEYFVVDVKSAFGEVREEELIPKGKSIRVIEQNKAKFISTKCFFTAYLQVQPQLDALAEGFHSVIPKEVT